MTQKAKSLRKLYTEKQLQALKAILNDFWILILHGAKRAGKTIADNDIFVQELIKVRETADRLGIPEPQYILAGNSLGTLERNVLTELRNKYGLEFHFDKFNRFKLFGVLVCCFGHGTIKDMSRIRGMTAFGAYINEATTGVEDCYSGDTEQMFWRGCKSIDGHQPRQPRTLY